MSRSCLLLCANFAAHTAASRHAAAPRLAPMRPAAAAHFAGKRHGLPQLCAADHDYEYELEFAARVTREAGELVQQASEGGGIVAARNYLSFELSHEPAISLGAAHWLAHVDDHVVSVALVSVEHGPVVGVCCRHRSDEMLCAATDAGTWYSTGDEAPTAAPDCGMASKYANVVHVPFAKSPEVELAVEALAARMPVDVQKAPAEHCNCCCEGLFELVSGRADVHIAPPEHCFVGSTPVNVLCAFEVLLQESGGCMSDVLGNDIDWAVAIESGAHRGGVLASDAASHSYMLHAMHTDHAFGGSRLSLPRLAEHVARGGFRVEHVGGGRHVVLPDGPGSDHGGGVRDDDDGALPFAP